MNKINNNVNFTGIKNIATVIPPQREGFKRLNNLSMVLTDNFNGKDMTEFKTAINKISDQSFSYRFNGFPEVVNIECIEHESGGKVLSLNNVALGDVEGSLSMFSYLAKLTKKISAMKDKDFIVNNDYKYDAAKETLMSGYVIEGYDKISRHIIDGLFEPENVKDAAKQINAFIQSIMETYFG